MPVTVPRSPKSGEIWAMVARVERFFSKRGISYKEASSIDSFICRRGRSYFKIPAFKICEIGLLVLSQICKASLISWRFILSKILLKKSWVSILILFKCQNFSKIIASAKMEHKSIGHITGPPAKNPCHKPILYRSISSSLSTSLHQTIPTEGGILAYPLRQGADRFGC